VQRAADDRQSVQRLGEQTVLLDVPQRPLAGGVRQLHHVRAGLGDEPEPTGQVDVENVEAAGAQAEVARLRVHDHLVAERERPGQPRVRDTRNAVDLDSRHAFVPLEHCGDGAASEAKRHAPPRARRA
jgi:hypothetical protein